ncbi:efflux RND transporter permease subunit [Aquella oligotrophica]|uniref:Efflux pump membrane transporter n=1 Tax=Aquella oligotrophica TaxID=2067065 RepID=A0A2I7N3U2_9NEIS|nr:efflux RND transporter permease subunit [Aquella oligotrophica]AUR51108.1 hydrophobe/amphiphile efflux-1 family RND transporter [Aquella oligotrophica]
MLRFFINNPVFSSVVSIIIVICGLVAIFNLPLAEYPNIAPPTITITAHYPGANAETIQKTVASPIEDQVNGANQMIYMNSVMSSNGDYNLVVTFAVGTNLNAVIGDVLNRLNTALPMLPQMVQNLGVTMRKSSQNVLMSISMQTDGRQDQVYLSNYTYRAIYTELVRVKGVGDVQMAGARTYSMRIWLQPDKMQKLGVTLTDVQNAINEQNVQVAVGQVAAPPATGPSLMTINLVGQSYYSDPKQFEQIVVRNSGVQYIRIKDIARVELGAFSYDTINKLDHDSTIGLQIYLDPSANQLATHAAIMETMERLGKQFPDGITYKISFDNTKFIKKALTNVAETLRDACILVVLVVFLFLQKGRATLIPILTIPVAVVGTFAGMYATGFSINNLTLFGLILSIGIVVDDSIVVIENVERIMEQQKCSAKEASIKSMEEVASALIAIVLVLCCAFIPSAFLGGLTGILYQQFAVTIAISVVLSGIVALTLTPALCAIMLKDGHQVEVKNRFFVAFNKGFEKFTDAYIFAVKLLLEKRKLFMGVFGGVLLLTAFIYHIMPVGFIPNEDKGFFMTQITLPNNASLQRTEKVTDDFVTYLLKDKKNIENSISLIGIDQLHAGSVKTNVATITADLVDWDERKDDVNVLISRANQFGKTYKDANFLSYNQPAIDGISNTNGIEMYIQDKVTGSYVDLDNYAKKMTAELNKSPLVERSYYTFNPYNQAYNVLVDIDRAKFYGLQVSDIYNLLEANYGPDLVNYFYRMGDLFWVTVQSDFEYRKSPEQLDNLYVRNSNESMVPVNSVVKTSMSTSPDVIERVNDYLATKIVVEPKDGITISQVIQLMNDVATKVLPKEYSYTWYGVAYQQANTGTTSTFAFAFGMIMIFLVLAGQYEMWRLPFVVIMGIPFALFGAGAILLMRGLDNDLYFQISLITLLGLSAKNAILIVEFAVEHWREGASTVDSVLIAARQRFRPIIMTSLAFILGALPLAIAHGANSNAEHSVGTGIIGGMLGSTLIAIIFVPLFFVVVMGKKTYTKPEDE